MSYYRTRKQQNERHILFQAAGQNLNLHHLDDLPGACISDQGGFVLTKCDWENLKKDVDRFFAFMSDEDIDNHNYQKLNPVRNKQEETKKRPRRKIRGYVYLIQVQESNRYKIGVSKDPEQRKASIQKQSPFELQIIHQIETEDSYGLEEQFHERFAEKRVNGEWFELAADDISWIKGQ